MTYAPDLTALHIGLCALLPEVAKPILSARIETHQKGQDELDFVTSVDLAVQAELETRLAALLPGSEMRGEEGYCGGATENPLWLVDPLDGTVNFVAGLPSFAIAVVLIMDRQPVLSAVHDVPHGITWSAIANQGAFENGTALRRRDHPAKLAILSSGLLKDLASHAPDALSSLLSEYKLRNFGSQALHLCYAAAGRVGLVASREAKGWDDMAGALVAREAGLVYGHYGPRPGAMDVNQHSICCLHALFEPMQAHFARTLT